MTINSFVNNSDLDLEAHILIRSYDDEAGETKEIYSSWGECEEIPHEILHKEITYVTIISGVNFPYLLIEFNKN